VSASLTERPPGPATWQYRAPRQGISGAGLCRDRPVPKGQLYLRETIPAGPNARREAEKTLTRSQHQVDQKRAPRTSATLDQLLDRYLDVGTAHLAPRTRREYMDRAAMHIRPMLGSTQIGKIDAFVLEALCADLAKCRDHCHRRKYIDHRTSLPHACDEHGEAGPCSPPDPGCLRCQRIYRPHQCKPLKDAGIRAIHFILSGAFAAGVRWGWLGTSPVPDARKPGLPASEPQPPTAAEAAKLVNEAWARDVEWGVFVWTAMTIGARRAEMCALRWHDVDLEHQVVDVRRALSQDEEGRWYESSTKTHQHRRIVLDPETTVLLAAHRARCETEAAALDVTLGVNAFVFSLAPDHSTFLNPDTATQRYERMARRLGIKTSLHKLRHYSATELLNGGMDVRAVAGRLGHGSGGAMTLRAYAAWLAEADQRAAPLLAGRMPTLPARVETGGDAATKAQHDLTSSPEESTPPGPYAQIARDLEAAIACGAFAVGDQLPTEKALAQRFGVAASTTHRALTLLDEAGHVRVTGGRRTVAESPAAETSDAAPTT
jgi:integrase